MRKCHVCQNMKGIVTQIYVEKRRYYVCHDCQRLTPQDRVAVDDFKFFLKIAGKPSDMNAPHRWIASAWYQGFITIDEGKRLLAQEVAS